MPLNNNFYGVYKFVTVKTQTPNGNIGKHPYIIQNLGDQNSEQAGAKFYMQGTPLTKVLDIAHTSQNIEINSPILCTTSGNALQDGLQLINDIIALQYTSSGIPNNALPILVSAVINIGVDNSNVQLTLKSDGDPNNTVNVYQINYGTTAQSYIAATGLNYASRVAKNYDFFIDFGGFKYFVESATIKINVVNSEHNFLGVYPENYIVPTDSLNGGVYQGDSSYSGWQFPFIVVGGVTIEASGKAAISIDNITGALTNYNYLSTPALTVANLLAASNVTLQQTGLVNYATDNFNIYFSGSVANQGILPPMLAINRAIVNSRHSQFTPELMTADFEIKAWVGVN